MLVMAQIKKTIKKALIKHKKLATEKLTTEEKYELSAIQKGMLYHSELNDTAGIYHLQVHISLNENIDVSLLQRAWRIVRNKYPILQCCLSDSDIQKAKLIKKKHMISKIETFDLTRNKMNQKKRFKKITSVARNLPFNLTQAPLMRIQLFKFKKQSYKLVWSYHHILLGGNSVVKVASDIMQIYDELKVGRLSSKSREIYPVIIPEFTMINKDWQKYWLDIFKDYSFREIQLCTKALKKLPIEQGTITNIIKRVSASSLQAQAKSISVTANTVILAAWAILLGIYADVDDVVLGSVRALPEEFSEENIGLFMNSLPIRANVKNTITVKVLLNNIRKQQNNFKHVVRTSPADLKHLLGINLGSDIYSTIVDYKPIAFRNYFKGQSPCFLNRDIDHFGTTNHDISLEIQVDDDALYGRVAYNKNKYYKQHIKKLFLQFEVILEALTLASECNSLGEIKEASLKKDFMSRFNNKIDIKQYSNVTLASTFIDVANHYPFNIAIRDSNINMKYGELNFYTNKIANYIGKRVSKKFQVVGIALSNKIDIIATMLALNKLNKTYVYLDTSLPKGRIMSMMNSSNMQIVICGSNAFNFNIKKLIFNKSRIIKYNGKNVKVVNEKSNPAFIIFTSGTTGTPKAIPIKDSSIINFVKDNDCFEINSRDRVAQVSSLAFDASTFEIWGALLNAASLEIICKEDFIDVNKFKENIVKRSVSIILLTTAYLNEIISIEPTLLGRINLVLFGGEQVNTGLFKKYFLNKDVLKPRKLIHLYGPAEATTASLYHYVTKKDINKHTIPIGKPMKNNSAYVLDHNLQLTPDGVIGELYISGLGLADGYLNQIKNTRKSFINVDFPDEGIVTLYKTNDLVRVNQFGEIEYIGRKDNQVKYNGYRIELEEIEKSIERLPAVKQAVALLSKDTNGHTKLLAYILFDALVKNISPAKIRLELKKYLPAYMLPSSIISIDSLPINGNGKIAKEALPLHDDSRFEIASSDSMVAYTQVERMLENIWQECLVINRVKININHNFYELGGDSIISISVAAKIRQKGYDISTQDILDNPTIYELARFLDSSEKKLKKIRLLKIDSVPLLIAQEWFFENVASDARNFIQSYKLVINEDVDIPRLKTAIEMALNNIDAFRTCFYKKDGLIFQKIINDSKTTMPIECRLVKNRHDIKDVISKIKKEALNHIELDANKLTYSVIIEDDVVNTDYFCFFVHHLIFDYISWSVLSKYILKYYQDSDYNITSKERALLNANMPYAIKCKEYINDMSQDYFVNPPVSNDKAATHNVYNTFCLSSALSDKEILNKNNYSSEESVNIDINISNINELLNMQIQKNISIPELLLAVLNLTFININKRSVPVTIALESTGRENTLNGIDITESISWFTIISEIVIGLIQTDDVIENIKSIHDQIRKIKTSSYLENIAAMTATNKRHKQKAEVSFNYLGLLTKRSNNELFLELEELKLYADIKLRRPFVLDLCAFINNNTITVKFDFNSRLLDSKKIELLASAYKDNLFHAIDKVLKENKAIYSIYDFRLPDITRGQFDQVIEKIHRINHSCKDIKITKLYQLSYLQQGLLFQNKLNNESSNYLIQAMVEVDSKVNMKIFVQVLRDIYTKFDIFRTGFIYDELSFPVQYVLKNIDSQITYLNWRVYNKSKVENKLNQFLKVDRENIFDLSMPPLLRFNLININNKRTILLATYHHIIMDGWSMQVFLKEIVNNYLEYGRIVNNNMDLQYDKYIDYIYKEMKKDKLSSTNIKNNVDSPSQLIGNINKNRESLSTVSVERYDISISHKLTDKLNAIAKKRHVSLNTIMQAAFSLLIHKYTYRYEVLIGMVLSGRNIQIENIENMLGLLIYSVPFSVKINPNDNLQNFLDEIQEIISHSDKEKFLKGHGSNTKINSKFHDAFDILYVFENYPKKDVHDECILASNLRVIEQTHFPLTCLIQPADNIKISISYKNNQYDENYIVNFVKNYLLILDGISDNRLLNLSEINISDDKKTKALIKISEGGSCGLRFPGRFLDYLNGKNNQKNAVISSGKVMTYKELRQKVNAFSNFFQVNEIAEGTVIALCGIKQNDIVAIILAIFSSNLTYLPIDRNLPQERINYMLDNAACRHVFFASETKVNEKITLKNMNLYNMNDLSLSTSQVCQHPKISMNMAAYIFYTSGSTGLPKGVIISYKSLLNLLIVAQRQLKFTSKDTFLSLGALQFDIVIFEILAPLFLGSTLLFEEQTIIFDENYFKELIKNYKVSIIQATPTAWKNIISHDDLSLKNIQVMSTGEAITKDLANKLFAKSAKSIFNLYGPTEATIWTSYYKLSKDLSNVINIPLGRPLENYNIYIVDQSLQLCSHYLPGEICIAGIGLAKYYLNNVDANRFIKNPFTHKKSYQTLYKTGDLGFWDENENLVYLGRKDRQIKVKGVRVELSEIERCLLEHKSIQQCIVIQNNNDENTQLLAYVVFVNKQNNNELELEIRQYLISKLPAAMQPDYLVAIETLPMNANNKIDLNRLPKPKPKVNEINLKCVHASSQEEKIIAKIWSEALKIEFDKISMSDNFFHAGGDSIAALYLISSLANKLNVNLEVQHIFYYPTVKSLADFIKIRKIKKVPKHSGNQAYKKDSSAMINLQYVANSRPIFLIHPIGGNIFRYLPLAKGFSNQRSVYAIQDPGIASRSYMFDSLTELAEYYFSLIKAVQTEGPYIIGGASFGSSVAIEIAKLLIDRDIDNPKILSIDGWGQYPAKVSHDRDWFENNITRQNKELLAMLPKGTSLPELILDLQWQRQQLIAKWKMQARSYDLVLFKAKLLLPVLQSFDGEFNHLDDTCLTKIKKYIIAGNHETMMNAPNIHKLIRQIKILLNKDKL